MINLDGMQEDELRDVAEALRRLANYCDYKGRAVYYRRTGLVVAAKNLEEACDRIYRKLPEWARW